MSSVLRWIDLVDQTRQSPAWYRGLPSYTAYCPGLLHTTPDVILPSASPPPNTAAAAAGVAVDKVVSNAICPYTTTRPTTTTTSSSSRSNYGSRRYVILESRLVVSFDSMHHERYGVDAKNSLCTVCVVSAAAGPTSQEEPRILLMTSP